MLHVQDASQSNFPGDGEKSPQTRFAHLSDRLVARVFGVSVSCGIMALGAIIVMVPLCFLLVLVSVSSLCWGSLCWSWRWRGVRLQFSNVFGGAVKFSHTTRGRLGLICGVGCRRPVFGWLGSGLFSDVVVQSGLSTLGSHGTLLVALASVDPLGAQPRQRTTNDVDIELHASNCYRETSQTATRSGRHQASTSRT